MKKLIYVCCLLFGLKTFGQVIPNKDFVVQIINGSGLDVNGVASAIDRVTGSIYTCGFINTVSSGRDMILVKLDSNLVQQWVVQYDFTNLNDRANDLVVDPATGAVYITGISEQGSGNGDLTTIKYNSSGVQQWVSRINGSNNTNDEGNSIAFDGTNVWVAGYTTITGKGKDAQIVKLNGSTGATMASPKRNGTSNTDDVCEKICLSNTSAFVTGYTSNTSTNKDFFVACVNLSTAALTWSTSTNGSASGDDSGLDALYNMGDLYVCGYLNNTTTGNDYYFARINASTGAVKYSNSYDGGYNGSDMASSMVSNKYGFYGLTGYVTNGSNTEYHTRMYDTSNVYWTHTQPINGSYTTIKPRIATDTIAYHYYIAGTYSNTTLDGYLYQVDPGGVKRWEQFHSGTGNARDAFVDLVVDGIARIFVPSPNETGTATNTYDYMMIRYSQTPLYWPLDSIGEDPSNAIQFYRNDSIVMTTSGSIDNSISYFTLNNRTADFIKPNQLSHVFPRLGATDADTDSLERIDITFVEANPYAECHGFENSSDTTNFYYGHIPNGRNVIGSRRIIEPNIWNLIDLHYYTVEDGLKLYFVVKPTASPSSINLNITNATPSIGGSGELILSNPFGDVTYLLPNVYQVGTLGNIITTTFTPAYSITGSMVSFNLGAYNTSLPLVIMMRTPISPTVTAATDNENWCTFYGGASDDIFYDVKTKATDVYVTGTTKSANFPVASSYQGTNGGSQDVTFVKFNNLGVRSWATYIGGSLDDGAANHHGIEVDNSGNSYSAFRTASTNFPLKVSTLPGAYYDAVNTNTTPGAPTDIAIVSLNNSGQLTWGTYFGGPNVVSNSFDIALDNNNYLIVTGVENGIPLVTPGGSYSSPFPLPTSGQYFLAKFDTNHSLYWSTYFGSGVTIEKVAVNSNNDIYIAGEANLATYSFDFKNPGGGALFVNSPQGGNFDAFIAKFNGTTNNLTWATFYGGNSDDKIHALAIDGSNNVIVSGETQSTSGFITGNSFGISNTSFSGTGTTFVECAGDAFLSKFNSSGVFVSDTYFGGTSNEGGYDVYARNNDLFIAAGTTSNDMPFYGSNPGSAFVQSSNKDGSDYGQDGYFTVMDNNFNYYWSTYFGGDYPFNPSPDIIYSNAASVITDNKYYIVGTTRSASTNFPLADPTGSSDYFVGTKSSAIDAFIAQFDLSATAIGISEYQKKNDNSVAVYPNPSSGLVYINNKNSGKYGINVYDMAGKMIKSMNNLSNETSVSTADLAQGIYLIKIFTKDYSITKKLVVN